MQLEQMINRSSVFQRYVSQLCVECGMVVLDVELVLLPSDVVWFDRKPCRPMLQPSLLHVALVDTNLGSCSFDIMQK